MKEQNTGEYDALVDEVEKLRAEISRLRAEREELRGLDDLYWCGEGCGFVDKDHRCEQWCRVYHIPGEARARIRAEARAEALGIVIASLGRVPLRRITEYASEQYNDGVYDCVQFVKDKCAALAEKV